MRQHTRPETEYDLTDSHVDLSKAWKQSRFDKVAPEGDEGPKKHRLRGRNRKHAISARAITDLDGWLRRQEPVAA